MDAAVNWVLIKNPINWIIIFLMLIFAMFIVESLFQLMGNNVPCGCHSSEKM